MVIKLNLSRMCEIKIGRDYTFDQWAAAEKFASKAVRGKATILPQSERYEQDAAAERVAEVIRDGMEFTDGRWTMGKVEARMLKLAIAKLN